MICEGWWLAANKCLSPNYNQRPDGGDISLLVIHNISLPPREYGGCFIEDFFLNRLDHALHPYFATIKGVAVSAHILIKRDGNALQFVNFCDRAWHAGASHFAGLDNCNDFSIGVELEGTDEEPFTPAQYDRLVDLTIDIMNTYPQITPERIVGHSDIAPGRKTDPGAAFDWSAYKARLPFSPP